jgi:hypothetical protein
MRCHYQLSLVLLLCINNALARSSSPSFGEYYPHTRWVDIRSRSTVLDVYVHRLVISEPSKPPVTVLGEWNGRTFLKSSGQKSFTDFFSVAYEGNVATFLGDKRLFDKGEFERLRPDPKK